MTFDAERRASSRSSASTSSCSTRAAAGWPARSASRREHYDVSVAVGERGSCPRCGEADDDTLIIADGFSCREQIAGLTGRGALHLAQVLQMAMHEGPDGPRTLRPESRYDPLGNGGQLHRRRFSRSQLARAFWQARACCGGFASDRRARSARPLLVHRR